MSGMWQRLWRRCAPALAWIGGVAVIVLAVSMALAQLLLPLLAKHPGWVAAELSERIHRQVGFSSLEGRWTLSGPLFLLHDVTVAAPNPGEGTALQIPEAELRLDFGGWILPARRFLNIRVRGLQLNLSHDVDGAWHVNGIGMAGGKEQQPFSMGRLSMDLWLDDLRVVVDDARLRKTYTLISRQLRLSRQHGQIRLGGLLRREGETASLRMAGRFQEDGSAWRLWFNVDNVALQSLLQGVDLGGYKAGDGRGSLAVWLKGSQGRVTKALVRFDLDTLAITSPVGVKVEVASLHGLVGMQRHEDGYELRWAGDDGSALVSNLQQPGTSQFAVVVAAHDLQVAPLLPWLALQPNLPSGLAQWLGTGQSRGRLTDVSLDWAQATGLQRVTVDFACLGIDAVGRLPGVTSLTGELRGDMQSISLNLSPQNTTLQLPQLFRQPLVLSKLDGTLAAWSQDGRWHIGADSLDFVGDGYAGNASAEIVLPVDGGKPFVDAYVGIDHADVIAAKLFWPVHAMPPATVAWLDNALVDGSLDQAQVVLRGDLGDWPFRHNEGRFEARAPITGLVLNYGKAWPAAVGVDVVASFIDNGMLVEASSGQSMGLKVDRAVAQIPDFAIPSLDLHVQGDGSGNSLLQFSANSPIASHQAATLAKMQLGGKGAFGFHLLLPLTHIQDAQLDGSLQLTDVDLNAPDWNLSLDKINGPLSFDLHGMRADALDAGFRGHASKLQLAIAGANNDPNNLFSAQLAGSYPLGDLLKDYPSLQWIGRVADGSSAFSINYNVAKIPGSNDVAQTIRIESPLTGIALNLPAPLDKSAADSLPLQISMPVPVAGNELQLALGDILQGRFRLPDTQHPLAATLMWGSQVPQDLPVQGIKIGGHANELDVMGWVQHFVGGSGEGGPGLESVDVITDQTLWFGYSLGKTEIHAKFAADTINVNVDGVAMSGDVDVPTNDMQKRGITARMKRLYWPQDTVAQIRAQHQQVPVSLPASARSQAVSSAAVPVAAASSTTPSDPANTGINPGALPPLHLLVDDLRLGDAKLGQSRLETWPTVDGMHIEQLRTLSSEAQINGSGDWNGSASNSHSKMRISFAAEDLGAMLDAFGFKDMVSGGKTHDELDASWPGAPSALSLANMTGHLNVHVDNGRIPIASTPGAGRVLGLVSLAELPRRLSFDFGDVFGKGFGFDSINGDFHLADGDATTNNLSIRGPAASIRVTGRTGLRARTFDQQMQIVPHLGNTLPVLGAVVGGPIGIAAGFAVQGLFGKGLNHVAVYRYRVSGSWDKPVMTKMGKEEMDAAALAPTLPSSSATTLPPLLPAPASSAAY